MYLCDFAHLGSHTVNYKTMDQSKYLEAKKLIARAYEVVLSEQSKFETKFTARNVLDTFNLTSEMLFQISTEAMKQTQLSLFETEPPKL